MKIRLCFVSILCFGIVSISAQTITGTITDGDGIPLPGATVLEVGTSNGRVSDFDGNFSIKVNSQNSILSFSFVGYLKKEITVQGKTSINVVLKADLSQLNEVVVVGYGTQKKSDITGAVSSIEKERLEQLPNTNFAQALQGSVAGVTVTTPSGGAEQANASILIRGRNSITAGNEPLIVLDNIPYSGSISDIVPSDIESIDILKGASASAIYGSRGSNGVILITTKKGKQGKVSISYDGFYSTQSYVDLPDVMNGAEFYDYKETREPGSITESEQAVFDNDAAVDWLDLITRQGSRSQHALSVSGGSESLQYFFSATRLDVKGIQVGDDFERTSLRMNVTADINDWIKLGTNTQLLYSDRSGLEANYGQGYRGNPLSSVFNADGNLTIYPWEDDINFTNPLGNTTVFDEDRSYDVFTNTYLNLDFPFAKGLSFRVNTGVRFSSDKNNTYYNRNTTAVGFENDGRAQTSSGINRNILIENILNYEKSFGKHKFNLTALYSANERDYEFRSLQGEFFPNDENTVYQMELAGLLNPGSEFVKATLVSQMGRLNYIYDDRYLATFTVRRDGYSGFGDDRKYGTFPSVALGWNISNESFFPDDSFINQLKLRAEYGKNGNQAVAPYSSLSSYDTFSYVDGGTTLPGYNPDRLSSPSLSWETSEAFNIGLDFAFFKNRITGTFEFYETNTFDLLLDRSIASTHGADEVIQNIGETKNSGFEISLSSRNIVTDNFQWSSNFNLSHNKNEIIDLYGDGLDDEANEWFIGQPINVIYDLQFDGVFQEGDDITNSAQPDARPGDVKIRDVNGDGVISADTDRVIIGQSNPDLNWGFANTFTYKGLSLYVFLQGVYGETKRNHLVNDLVFDGVRRNTTNLAWWTPENQSNKYWANDIDANPLGIRIYEKADFIRLRDVSLAYNLPRDVLDKLGMRQLKVYLSGRNLLTITDFEGIDPEMSDQLGTPLQKEILLGLNFSF